MVVFKLAALIDIDDWSVQTRGLSSFICNFSNFFKQLINFVDMFAIGVLGNTLRLNVRILGRPSYFAGLRKVPW